MNKLLLKLISKLDGTITYEFKPISIDDLSKTNQESYVFYKETETHYIFAKIVPQDQILPPYQIIFKDFTTESEIKKFLKDNDISTHPIILRQGNILIYYLPYEKLELLKSKYNVVLQIASIAEDNHVCDIYNSLVPEYAQE